MVLSVGEAEYVLYNYDGTGSRNDTKRGEDLKYFIPPTYLPLSDLLPARRQRHQPTVPVRVGPTVAYLRYPVYLSLPASKPLS